MNPDPRLSALGNQLVDIHLQLREHLAALREDLTAAHPVDLRLHCLTFCAALTRHHTAEDDTAFPAVLTRYPQMAGVVAELRRDHELVADLVRQVADLVDGLGPDPGAAALRRVRTEVDGLAALLESHFTYEERRLVAALDALTGGPVRLW